MELYFYPHILKIASVLLLSYHNQPTTIYFINISEVLTIQIQHTSRKLYLLHYYYYYYYYYYSP